MPKQHEMDYTYIIGDNTSYDPACPVHGYTYRMTCTLWDYNYCGKQGCTWEQPHALPHRIR
jgi:hypothetical protein